MAFCSKAGNLLGRIASNRISREISSTKPSIFQAIRCMSTSKLFIRAGLSPGTDDATLKDAFSKYGQVSEARVIADRRSGKSKGFGYITYSSADEDTAAVEALHNQSLHGRRIKVNYANDRVRLNEGDECEGSGIIESYSYSDDLKKGGVGEAYSAVGARDDQEYYASKGEGAMMEVVFSYSTYYGDLKS